MRVLSGIQPTGRPHWGNYFGAIRQYVDLQHEEAAYYFIANLHALTTVRDAAQFADISPQPIMKVIPEEEDSQAHEAQGEDCLMLNVWTPQLGAGRRPVERG